MSDDEVGVTYHKLADPVKFYAQCDENLAMHEKAIKKSYDRLVEAGVPEKFIFVINANGDYDSGKSGDLFAYSNKMRLNETLNSVRNGAMVCCSPDVFIFLCADIRDEAFMSRYLNASYFSAKWFKEMYAEIQ